MALKGDNVVVPSMKLERMFSMKGGKGEASYANNSQAQAIHARSVLHFLEETLDSVQLNCSEIPFVVADLGCSSGTNTISTVEVIINHMIKRYEALGYEPPEFSAFFSDLPCNDFNTLFQLLPPLANYSTSMEEFLAAKGHRPYFAAGVPGSFHRRLFPSRSIDVFHSAFSLHWLSQIIEADGSFTVNKLEVFKGGSPLVVNQPDNAAEVGRALANSCRTVAGVLVDAHIGDRLSDELFLRVERRATSRSKELLEQLQFFHIVASLSK
ncbi:hypothetical protein HS088_TW21G00075 [Tripterygium wilfordii]|uniref:Indole-3-acetate O-methyltransferase 1 n=1 Tax=Tripterygium wilfordii TaxID=458696 RepID=A0A7J7C1Y6_TRIWF|nr:hypothetical protein HS088_TW21G00075 [Tripterygium wilfordii]